MRHYTSGTQWKQESPQRQFLGTSDSANSYRAEQLGICAIHHLITAMTSYYNIGDCACKIWCDNMGAVNISKKRQRRIRPGASCADILRNIRNTRNKTTAKIKYEHVDGHMDKYLLLTQMTLEQQMNYWCDKEANKAVERSIQHKFVIEGGETIARGGRSSVCWRQETHNRP